MHNAFDIGFMINDAGYWIGKRYRQLDNPHSPPSRMAVANNTGFGNGYDLGSVLEKIFGSTGECFQIIQKSRTCPDYFVSDG